MSLYQLEIEHAQKGAVALNSDAGSDSAVSTYRARLGDQDYRKALGALKLNDVSILETIRTLIAVGDLRNAEIAISQAKGVEQGRQDSELELEQTRIHYYNGQWNNLIETSNRIFSELSPPGHSQIVLHQLRAMAYLELGEYARSRAELESIKALTPHYPHAPVLVYARSIELRLNALTGSCEIGRSTELVANHFQILGQQPNLDQLLTHFRFKSWIETRVGANAQYSILSALLLAQELGDRLYLALALTEWVLTTDCSSSVIDTAIQTFRNEYPRVEQLLSRVDSLRKTPADGFALRMIEGILQGQPLPERIFWVDEQCSKFRGLQPTATLVHASPRVLQAATCLRCREADEETLFSSLYPKISFDPEKHSPGIRTVLSRLRKLTGLSLKMIDGKVMRNSREVLL